MVMVYRRELVATSALFVSPLYALSRYHFYVPTWIHTLIVVQGCVSMMMVLSGQLGALRT